MDEYIACTTRAEISRMKDEDKKKKRKAA